MITKRGPRVKNAKKTTMEIDGKPHTFPSHLEALRYIELKQLKKAGIVTEIECQPAFILQEPFRKCCGLVIPDPHGIKRICPFCKKKTPLTKPIIYRADFRITYADGHEEIEDVKGMETEVFKLKQKMFEYRYPDLSLKLVKRVRQ
jgi:hypothetical protein